MKWIIAVIIAVVFFGVGFTAGRIGGSQSASLSTNAEMLSYSLGVQTIRDLKADNENIDPAAVARGVKDGSEDKELPLSYDEIDQILKAYNNKKQGEKFLEENGKKEGVVTLPSGLQYKILKEGKGEKPKATDSVLCHYRGTLLDGTEFDSSYKRGEPLSFSLQGVIAGWTEALQLMPVGSKWQLFIPSDLAYGEQGGGPIPPNATLVFEVELLGIE